MTEALNSLKCTQCMSRSKLFDKLSDEEQSLLAASRSEVRFKKGETIAKQGALAAQIMYVRSGIVKIYQESEEKNLVIGIKTAGHFVGLSVLFSNATFPFSIATYSDTEICMFDIHKFRQLTRQNAAFASEIIHLQNNMIMRRSERLECLTMRKLPGRLASMLLCISKRVYQNTEFELGLSRKDLAEISMMSIESLSRLLTDFKKENLIELVGKRVKLLNLQRLQMISKNG